MAKKLVAFLVGVGLASAWWSIAIWPPPVEGKPTEAWPLIPAVATFVFLVLLICQLIHHWED